MSEPIGDFFPFPAGSKNTYPELIAHIVGACKFVCPREVFEPVLDVLDPVMS